METTECVCVCHCVYACKIFVCIYECCVCMYTFVMCVCVCNAYFVCVCFKSANPEALSMLIKSVMIILVMM